MLLGAVAGIVTGEFGSLDLSRISFQSCMGMMYMITIGSLLGFPIFVWLLQKTSEFVANSFSFVSPVVAIIMGWTILNESFSMQIIVPTFILLGSVMMIMTSEWTGKGNPRRLEDKHSLGY
jgi:drug/metabolite transporter (DMT)-like permease